jgi:hypothetical protein
LYENPHGFDAMVISISCSAREPASPLQPALSRRRDGEVDSSAA